MGAMLVATNWHNLARTLDLDAGTEGLAFVSLAIVAAVLVALRWVRRERRARPA